MPGFEHRCCLAQQALPAAAAKPPDPASRPTAKTADTQSAVPAADVTAAEVATPTSPAAAAPDPPPANESDGATVTDEGEGGGAVAANGDAAGGGGGATSREQRPRPPRPGWPTHLPWPLPDPPPSRITLPGPRGPLVYVLATHQVCLPA